MDTCTRSDGEVGVCAGRPAVSWSLGFVPSCLAARWKNFVRHVLEETCQSLNERVICRMACWPLELSPSGSASAVA